MVNLPIEYSSKQVTPFGGMSLIKHFLGACPSIELRMERKNNLL